MPVIESPAWSDWPIAPLGPDRYGHFVLMRIDPVASVEALEDEEVTRAAAAIVNQEWVLGIVLGNGGLSCRYEDGTPKPSLHMFLVGQGLPDDKPIASLPIAPSPQVYDDRPPFQLGGKLPWPNLYLWTNCNSSVIISRMHHGDNTLNASLTDEQIDAVLDRCFDDQRDWRKLPPVDPEPEPETQPDPPEVDEDTSSEQSYSTGESAESDAYSSDIDIPALLGIKPEKERDDESIHTRQVRAMARKLMKVRIYAEISVDPATCPGLLGRPNDLARPVRQIREIWNAWESRTTAEILAKRPQTNAWLEGVGNAGLDGADELDAASLQLSLEDLAILPEDAVDDRIERARAARRPHNVEVTIALPSAAPRDDNNSPAAPAQPPPLSPTTPPNTSFIPPSATSALVVAPVPVAAPPTDSDVKLVVNSSGEPPASSNNITPYDAPVAAAAVPRHLLPLAAMRSFASRVNAGVSRVFVFAGRRKHADE